MSQHKAFFKAILAVFCVAAFLVTASNALAFTEQANSQTSIDKISVVGAGGKINIIDSEKSDPAKVSAAIRNYPLNDCIDTRYVSPGDNLQVSFFLNTYTTPDGFNHWFVRYGCAKDPASIVETSVIGKSYSPTIAWKTPTFIKGQYCKIWIYAMKGTNSNEDTNTKIGGANTRPIGVCTLSPVIRDLEVRKTTANSFDIFYRWYDTGDSTATYNGKAYLYVYDSTCTKLVGYAGPVNPWRVEDGSGYVYVTKSGLSPSTQYCIKPYVVSAGGVSGFGASKIVKTLASAPKAGESLETNFVICRKTDVNTCSPFTVQNPTTLSGCKAQIANLGIAKLADCYLASDSTSVSECNSLCKNVDSGTGPYIEITQPTANNLTCLSQTATSKVEAYLPTKVSITTGATADIFFEIFDKAANKVVLSQSYANKSGNVQIDYKPQLEQYKEYQFRVLASDSLNHTSRQTVDFKTPDCLPAQELSYCEGLVCKGLKISQDKCRALNGGKDCAAGLNCSGLQCTGSTALSVEAYIPETTDFNCLAKTLTSKVETSVLGKLVGTGTSANANVFLDIYEKVSGKAIASQYFMGKVAGDQVSFKSTLDQGLEYRFKVSAYNAQTSAEKTVYFTTPYCATPESNENLSYCAGTVCKGLNTTKSNCRTLNNGVDCVSGLYCGSTASNPDATCKAPVTANFTLSIPEVSVKDCSAAGAKADVSVIILPNLGTATGGNVVVEQLNSLGNVVASKTFSSVASYQNYYWSFVIGATETAKVRATLYVVGGKVSYTKDVVVKCGSEATGDYSYCDNLACRSTVSTPSACKALNKGVDCYKGKYCEGTVSNPDTKCLGKDSNRIVIELPSQFDQICMGDTLIRAIVRTRVNATYNGAAGTVTMKILGANGTELLSKQYTNALAGSAFGEEFNFQPGQKYTVSAKLSAGGGTAQNIFSEFIPKTCAPTDTVKEYSYCSGIVCNTVKTTAAQCKVRNNGVDCFDVPYCGGNASDYGDSKCSTQSKAYLETDLSPQDKAQFKQASKDNQTLEIPINVYNLKAKNGDVDVSEFRVYLEAKDRNGNAKDVSSMVVYNVALRMSDGTSLESRVLTRANDGAYILSGFQYPRFNKDISETLTVRVGVKKIGDVLQEGDSIRSIIKFNASNIKATDSVTKSPISWPAGSEKVLTGSWTTFYSSFPVFNYVSHNGLPSSVTEGNGDVTFSIEAVGGDIYLNRDNSAIEAFMGNILNQTPARSDSAYAFACNTDIVNDASPGKYLYVIREGWRKTCTVSFVVYPKEAAYHYASVKSITFKQGISGQGYVANGDNYETIKTFKTNAGYLLVGTDQSKPRSYCSGTTCKTVNTTAASCKTLNNGADCFTTAYCGGSASDYGDSKCGGGFVVKFTNPLNNQSLFIGDSGEISIETKSPNYQFYITKKNSSVGILEQFCYFTADASGKGKCAWTVGNYTSDGVRNVLPAGPVTMCITPGGSDLQLGCITINLWQRQTPTITITNPTNSDTLFSGNSIDFTWTGGKAGESVYISRWLNYGSNSLALCSGRNDASGNGTCRWTINAPVGQHTIWARAASSQKDYDAKVDVTVADKIPNSDLTLKNSYFTANVWDSTIQRKQVAGFKVTALGLPQNLIRVYLDFSGKIWENFAVLDVYDATMGASIFSKSIIAYDFEQVGSNWRIKLDPLRLQVPLEVNNPHELQVFLTTRDAGLLTTNYQVFVNMYAARSMGNNGLAYYAPERDAEVSNFFRVAPAAPRYFACTGLSCQVVKNPLTGKEVQSETECQIATNFAKTCYLNDSTCKNTCSGNCLKDRFAYKTSGDVCCSTDGYTEIDSSVLKPDGSCTPGNPDVKVCSKCGDGFCGGMENKCNCPADCGPLCSKQNANADDPALCCPGLNFLTNKFRLGQNGTCVNSGFTNGICVNTKCGDGKCEGYEDKCNCPADCKDVVGCKQANQNSDFPALCCSGLGWLSNQYRLARDGSCIDSGFTNGVCVTTKCGDNKCEGAEDKCNCPLDCTTSGTAIPGTCITDGKVIYPDGSVCCSGLTKISGKNLGADGVSCVEVYSAGIGFCSKCGDGKCENPENKCNCPQDCACGNGVCDNSENYQTCPQDCKEPTAQKYCYKGMYIYFSDYPNPKANNAKYWLSNWDLGNNIKGFLGNDAAAKAAAEMYVAALCDGNNSKSYNCSECERLDLIPEVVEKICFNQQGYYYRANKPSKETGTQFWVKIVLGGEPGTLKYEKEGDLIAFMRSFKVSNEAKYAEPCTGKEELFDFNYCDKSSPAKCQQEDKTTLTQCETKYGKGNCFKADPTCAGKCAKMEAFCRKCVHGMCAYYNPFGNDQTVNNAKWYIQDYVKGREVQPVGSDLEVDVVGRIENLWQGPQKESYDFAQCNTSDQMVDCYKNIVIWFAPAGNPKISGMKYYAKIVEDGNREFYIGGGYSADQNANIATIRSVLDSYVANTPNYTKQCFTDAKPGITRPPSIPDLSSAGKLYYYYDKKLNTCTQTDSTFATPNLCVANLKKMPLVLVAFPNCYESEDACWSAGRLYWYEKLVNGKWEFVLTSSRYKTEADCVAALKKFFTKNQAKYKCYLDKPGAEYLVVRKADTNNWIKKTGPTTAEGSIGLLLTAANGDVHLPVYNPNANDGIVMSGSIVGNNSLFDVGYSYICDATKSGDGTYYIIPKGRGSLCIISGKLTAQQKGKYYFAIKEINFEAVTTGAITKYNSQLVPIFSTFKTESVDLDSAGGSAPVCGNGNCEDGESKISCPQDCDKTPATCGNGNCDNGETAKNCPQDCNICLKAGPLVLSACGDGRCKASDGETISSCPLDCNLGKDAINLATPNKNYTTLLKVRGINSNNTLSRNMLWVPYSFSSIATNKCNTVKVRFQFMPYDYSTGKDKQNILNTIGDVSFQFKNGASLNRAIGAKFEKQSDGSLKSDGINYFGITTYEFLINTPDPNINDYGVIKISKKEKTSWTDSSGATYTIDPYEIVFPINAYPMDCSCQAIARCGDGNCDNGETIDNCTVDCGVPILNISNAVVPKNVAADDPYYKGEWQYCYPDGKTLSPDCKKMFYCDLRNACVGRACNVTETSRYYYKLTSCQDGLTYQAALKGKTTGYCYNTRQEAETACQRYYFCAAGNGTATNVLLTKKAYTDVYDCTRTFKTDESTSGPIGQCYENEQEAKDHCARWYYCPADPAKKGCSPTNVYADEAACVAAVIKNVPKALPKCYSNQDTCNSACQSNTLWTAYDDGKGTITCDQVKEKDRNGAIKQFYGKIEDAISECRQWLDTNNRKDTNRDCYKSFSDCDVAVSGTGRMRVCRRAGDEKCIALPTQYENTQTGCQKFLDDNKGLVGLTRCYDALYSADCDKACKDAGATAFKGAFYVKPDTTNNLNGGCLAISTFENNKTACDSELNKAWGTQTYSQCFNDVNDCNIKPKNAVTNLPSSLTAGNCGLPEDNLSLSGASKYISITKRRSYLANITKDSVDAKLELSVKPVDRDYTFTFASLAWGTVYRLPNMVQTVMGRLDMDIIPKPASYKNSFGEIIYTLKKGTAYDIYLSNTMESSENGTSSLVINAITFWDAAKKDCLLTIGSNESELIRGTQYYWASASVAGGRFYYYSKKTDTCVQTYKSYSNRVACEKQLLTMKNDAYPTCYTDKKSCDAGGQRMWFFKRAGLNGEYAQTTERYTDIASCVSNLRIYYPSNQAYYQCYWSRAQLAADDKLDKFRLPFYTKIGGKCSYAGKYATQKGCEYALSAQCSLDPTCSVK